MAQNTPIPHTSSVPFVHRFPAWGVDVVESHHAEDWRMDYVRHDFLKIVFLAGGQGSLVLRGNERIQARRGNLLVVPAGREHRLEDGQHTPMSLYVLSIRPEILRVAALDPKVLPSGRIDLEPRYIPKIEMAVRRLLFEQSLEGPQAGARVVSLTLRLLTELIQLEGVTSPGPGLPAPPLPRERLGALGGSRTGSSARMAAYVEDLEQHFFEATKLDDAAAHLGISRRRFTQLFREVTGSSWLAYIRRLRIAHARRLLIQTSRTVLSIAFECGFEDLSTFYRAFKREVGQSPNQWRGASRTDPSR